MNEFLKNFSTDKILEISNQVFSCNVSFAVQYILEQLLKLFYNLIVTQITVFDFGFCQQLQQPLIFFLEESKKVTIVPDENNPGKKIMINILLFVNLYTANFSEVEKLSKKQH